MNTQKCLIAGLFVMALTLAGCVAVPPYRPYEYGNYNGPVIAEPMQPVVPLFFEGGGYHHPHPDFLRQREAEQHQFQLQQRNEQHQFQLQQQNMQHQQMLQQQNIQHQNQMPQQNQMHQHH